nr:rac GTPase-activating protein 1-like [Onthophagus taurus]
MNYNYNGKYTGTPVHRQFKTPTAKRKLKTDTGTVKRCKSDSEDSISSNPESVASSSKDREVNVLSLVALFDELMRSIRKLNNAEIEDHFMSNVEHFILLTEKWRESNVECQRLQIELDKKTHELSDVENKLSLARKLLDQEKKLRKKEVDKVENERDLYLSQLLKLRTILTKDCWNNIPREARDNLNLPGMRNISEHNIGITSPPQNFIPEGNTTGSLLSDFSYSMSEDDFDGTSKVAKNWQKLRPSLDGVQGEPATKKRRSSGNHVEINTTETVRATTTLTVAKKGPITATSIIESIPKVDQVDNNKPQHPVNNVLADLWKSSPQKLQTINKNIKLSQHRQHSFQMKTIVMPDTCGVCEKRIRFAKNVVKCKVCRSVCHPECKDKLPLPCIPCANTPTHRLAQGIISDYTPTTAPMVPAIIVHCLNEIEAKGMKELGIYRIPGAEKDVKGLKDRFFKGKAAPILTNIDIHVICGVVKDFLRFLREPLVSKSLRGEFIKAVECSDKKDVAANLCQIISELPQPNRDTLAYIILHLKKVAESKECKMPLTNLAKVFGPTIVGFSSNDLEDMGDCLKETGQQYNVMINLLELPVEYWQDFVIQQQLTMKLQQTPSTDSLLRPTPNRLFSTRLERDFIKKRKNILTTPSSLLT